MIQAEILFGALEATIPATTQGVGAANRQT